MKGKKKRNMIFRLILRINQRTIGPVSLTQWSRSIQGHHMKTLVVLEYPMLYTKFQGHRPIDSEEEDFWSFSPNMGMVMWPGPFEQIFIPHIPWRLTSIGIAVSEQKKFENVESEWPWTKVNELTFDIHTGSCAHLVDWMYQLWYHRLQ